MNISKILKDKTFSLFFYHENESEFVICDRYFFKFKYQFSYWLMKIFLKGLALLQSPILNFKKKNLYIAKDN